MRVIRGMHGDRVVYVFSTDQTRGGFEEAADRELEGIPFGDSKARFIHIWHSDVVIPSELSDRVLLARELAAHHPEILAALDAEHEAQLAEGQAKMAAANRPRARRHGAESARTTKPAPRGADQPDLFGAGAKRPRGAA
jgi:hypothetical protein